MTQLPAGNVTPFPCRERTYLPTSVHAPTLGAFDRTLRQISALSLLVLDSTMELSDKNDAMEAFLKAANYILQANVIYLEGSVVPDIGRSDFTAPERLV